MKSKVTIGVDYDNTPILKIEHTPSDDVRDILVERFINAFGAQSSWGKFRMVANDPRGSLSDSDVRRTRDEMMTSAVIRPLMPIEMEGHARLMTVWARHLKQNMGVEMIGDEEVNRQANPGGMGLNAEEPMFKTEQFTKGMLIETGGNHYKCICADEETAVFGKITKWNEQECRVSHEITFCYAQDKWSNTDYRIISPLVPARID